MPVTRLDFVRPGGFCGYMPSHHREKRPETYDKPLCWIPKAVDNSAGGQVWVTSDRWGPLKGQLLHLSYGRCELLLVLREEVDGQVQGGVVTLPLKFASGIMRGRFHPLVATSEMEPTHCRLWGSRFTWSRSTTKRYSQRAPGSIGYVR